LSHAELQMQSRNLAALQHPLLQRGTATVSLRRGIELQTALFTYSQPTLLVGTEGGSV